MKSSYVFRAAFIGLAIIAIAALALFSGCKKCAECTTTVTQTVTGQQAVTGISTSEMCGDDLKEADGYETYSTATVSGHTATIKTKTECK